MTIEASVFQKVKIEHKKLLAFGFKQTSSAYVYETDFCDGEFHAILTVDDSNRLFGRVIEKETREEYLPLRVRDVTGEFVHHVRDEYIALLQSIAIEIGTPVPFQSDQANRIALMITEKYGDVPDFPWNDAADDTGEYAVLRHRDNKKWYALLMYTEERNLKTESEKAAAKKKAEEEEENITNRSHSRSIKSFSNNNELNMNSNGIQIISTNSKKQNGIDMDAKDKLQNLQINLKDDILEEQIKLLISKK